VNCGTPYSERVASRILAMMHHVTRSALIIAPRHEFVIISLAEGETGSTPQWCGMTSHLSLTVHLHHSHFQFIPHSSASFFMTAPAPDGRSEFAGSTEHDVFSSVQTYAQLLEVSHTVRVAAVILDRVRKHRSDHKSTISLEDAYQYKRGRALGTVERPPRPRGPRQLHIASRPERDSQVAPLVSSLLQQPVSESVVDTQHHSQAAPLSPLLSQQHDTTPPASVVAALNNRIAQHESEISELRVQLERAVQLAERATADLALLRQQLQERVEPPKSSRKRKPSTTTPIDPASLKDHRRSAHHSHAVEPTANDTTCQLLRGRHFRLPDSNPTTSPINAGSVILTGHVDRHCDTSATQTTFAAMASNATCVDKCSS
jgi:hypothetical protein